MENAPPEPLLPTPLHMEYSMICFLQILFKSFPKGRKKTEKSDIIQIGRVGWTLNPYFRKEWNSDTIIVGLENSFISSLLFLIYEFINIYAF